MEKHFVTKKTFCAVVFLFFFLIFLFLFRYLKLVFFFLTGVSASEKLFLCMETKCKQQSETLQCMAFML